jgi:RND family efflux transporter MFP subunit
MSRLLLFAFGLVLVGCGKRGLPAPEIAKTTPAKANLRRPVELTQASQRTIVSTVEQVGAIEANQATEIAAGVSGIVDEVLFEEGQLVDPKDRRPLIRIDQEKYTRAYEAATAAEKRAKANLARSRDASERASATAGATSDAERRQTLETMNASEADLLVAQANMKLARHNFERSQVPPPYRGQMNQRRITPGSYVKEDTIIGTIADLSEIRVVAYVPESAAPMIRERMEQRGSIVAARSLAATLANTNVTWGQLATVALAERSAIPSGYDVEFTVPSMPQRPLRASLFYMSTVADPTTHMFECKARIDARDPHYAMLKPGFTARIRFPFESNANAVVVPEESVRATERGFLVFVPEKRSTKDGQVEWIARSRRVEPGARSPGWVELRAGIQPNTWVVQRGSEALDDGVPLRISDDQVKNLN